MSDPALKGIPQFDKFEIVKTGLITGHTILAGTQELLTIPHGLGYVPVPMAMVDQGGFFVPLPTFPVFGFSAGTFTISVFSRCYSDIDNIYIETTNGAAGSQSAYAFKYFLMRSKANQ